MHAKRQTIEYRICEAAPHESWGCISTDEQLVSGFTDAHLHFHNCIELGYCHQGSGVLAFENSPDIAFKAGDIYILPVLSPISPFHLRDAQVMCVICSSTRM